ncbi:MAG: ATP-binding cassette domain-containing protein [Bifidobacteriaceae bacterium]|nr:ATP-binding cassette domain-containing protein [Bifidobacteriaceae bacterium]MCI1978684.1 ATP-binding cassette domain-containing protein [Bifidobacteriaceae bacterium]
MTSQQKQGWTLSASEKNAITLRGVSKRYGHTQALDGINLDVKKGSIYGLIGPNGAGKSTMFRVITGLTTPNSGTLTLEGHADKQGLSAVRQRMGCEIESPAIYDNLTVEQNMEVQCLQRGIHSNGVIDDALKSVGLQDQKKKKGHKLSLGMKQRLGLALLLIGEPEILLLDEPTNGLDPTGIMDLRTLLLELNQNKGITMLIASHILGELQHLATHWGIIYKGHLLEEKSTDEIKASSKRHIRIVTDDVKQAAKVLRSDLKTNDFTVDQSAHSIFLHGYTDEPTVVSDALSAQHVHISEFSVVVEDLESYYARTIKEAEKA